MTGEIEVGYNIDKYFESQQGYSKPGTMLKNSLSLKHQESTKMKNIFDKFISAKSKKSQSAFDKYAFPVVFKPGQAIGMYEMSYQQ